jgi:hypothetical protein
MNKAMRQLRSVLRNNYITTRAVVTLWFDGNHEVDVIFASTDEAADAKAIQHGVELAERIVLYEWGQPLPEGGVRSEFEFDPETEIWKWSSVKDNGVEIQVIAVDEKLVAQT